MEYNVTVLKEGYSRPSEKDKFHSCGTVTLVKGAKNIVVDTGSPWDGEFIINKLKENGITPELVEYVVCTHGHSDHIGNLNLFRNAVCIVSYDICHRDEYVTHAFDQGIPFEIDNGVEVIPTPGHSGQDVSVVVRNSQGTIVIAGDLFECEEDLSDPSLWQSQSLQPDIQKQSRAKVLDIANFIIPGHGCPFPVVESYRRQGSVTEGIDENGGGDIDRANRYSVEEAE